MFLGGIPDSKLPLYCTRAKHWQKLYKSVAQNEAPLIHKKTVRALLQTKQHLCSWKSVAFKLRRVWCPFPTLSNGGLIFQQLGGILRISPRVSGRYTPLFWGSISWSISTKTIVGISLNVGSMWNSGAANCGQFPSFCWLPRFEIWIPKIRKLTCPNFSASRNISKSYMDTATRFCHSLGKPHSIHRLIEIPDDHKIGPSIPCSHQIRNFLSLHIPTSYRPISYIPILLLVIFHHFWLYPILETVKKTGAIFLLDEFNPHFSPSFLHVLSCFLIHRIGLRENCTGNTHISWYKPRFPAKMFP